MTRLSLVSLSCVLAAALSLHSSSVRAEEPVDPLGNEAAKQHVEAGVAHYDAGRYAEASQEFEIAYRMSNRPALLFNIARAKAHLGKEEEAIGFLKRYVEARPDAPDSPSVRAEIDARERALAASAAAHKAEDDASVARQAAAATEQRMIAERVSAAVALDHARRETRRVQLRNAGIGLAAVGGIFVITGIALGAVAEADGNTIAGRKNMMFTDADATLEKRGQLFTKAGISLDVIGVVAAAAGGGLLGYVAHDRAVNK